MVLLLWSGAANAIPNGWVLCDGQNNTPDLRNRFVVGAGDSYAVDATGGADSVTLTEAQMPSHTHGSGSYGTDNPGDHTHTYVDQQAHNEGYRPWKAGDNDCGSRDKQTGGAGGHTHSITGSSGSAGSGNSHENRPPYYALCYIMKT